MKKKVFLSCLTVLLGISYCSAQVPSSDPNNGVVPAILNTAGGSYDQPSSYYRFEWSFGELFISAGFCPARQFSAGYTGRIATLYRTGWDIALHGIIRSGRYKLFPNPTAGKFELDFFVRTPGTMRLQLINSAGQVLLSKEYYYDGCCRIEMFDISHYPNGIYYVIADLRPDANRPGDNLEVIRHSGFKVIKLNEK